MMSNLITSSIKLAPLDVPHVQLLLDHDVHDCIVVLGMEVIRILFQIWSSTKFRRGFRLEVDLGLELLMGSAP